MPSMYEEALWVRSRLIIMREEMEDIVGGSEPREETVAALFERWLGEAIDFVTQWLSLD